MMAAGEKLSSVDFSEADMAVAEHYIEHVLTVGKECPRLM